VPGYTRTFGNLPASSAIVANGYPADIQARQRLKYSKPEYLVAPLIVADDTPLGRAYMEFKELGKRLMAEGVPASNIADQGLIDVSLFFRTRLATDLVNASTWTAEMLRSFRGTFKDALLLACAGGVAHLMRWLIDPTLENYRSMPSLVRPTDLQRFKPHAAWVDLMVFPSFRDALINVSGKTISS
jgi:hypothetical protein